MTKPPAMPEFNGWYCAHCQRGVDASEVTFHEQHTVCGRVITNDAPPASHPAEVSDDDILTAGHRLAWRYKHSTDPSHSSTYTFNRACLLQFARAILAPQAAPASDAGELAYNMGQWREDARTHGSDYVPVHVSTIDKIVKHLRIPRSQQATPDAIREHLEGVASRASTGEQFNAFKWVIDTAFESLDLLPAQQATPEPKPFAAPGRWFPVDVLGNPMREFEPGKWEAASWPSAATPKPSRGMIGMGAHALANELAQAVAQDDADPDGHDMSAGLFGPNVSAWLRKISADYLPQPATPEPVDWRPIKTSAGGREAVRNFFRSTLKRHDFDDYITGALAADFACVLGGYLQASRPAPCVPEGFALPRDDFDRCREWFDCIQDVHGSYLDRHDYELAKKLYTALGMRVPNSINDRLTAAQQGAEQAKGATNEH